MGRGAPGGNWRGTPRCGTGRCAPGGMGRGPPGGMGRGPPGGMGRCAPGGMGRCAPGRIGGGPWGPRSHGAGRADDRSPSPGEFSVMDVHTLRRLDPAGPGTGARDVARRGTAGVHQHSR
ncbi:hypothetical protein ERC79_11445 [Rhodococcus sp. ABRD24]|nr:hypothetical protein ERC79_11445 [Rhodococcus sp. ABRD24]